VLVENEIAEKPLVDRIQPAEGLVEDEQVRPWITAATNCTFCCIPFDSSSQGLPSTAPSPTRSSPFADAGPHSRPIGPFQASDVEQEVAGFHLLVEAAFLREISDPILRL